MSILDALIKLHPGAIWDTLPHTVPSYHHIVWRDATIPKPTEKALLEFRERLDAAETNPSRLLRLFRDKHLQQSDVRVLPDFPQSAETRQAWLVYRQQLRDLPQQYPNPTADPDTGKLHQVVWPIAPNGEVETGVSPDPVPEKPPAPTGPFSPS
jgi:hypothetical protein